MASAGTTHARKTAGATGTTLTEGGTRAMKTAAGPLNLLASLQLHARERVPSTFEECLESYKEGCCMTEAATVERRLQVKLERGALWHGHAVTTPTSLTFYHNDVPVLFWTTTTDAVGTVCLPGFVPLPASECFGLTLASMPWHTVSIVGGDPSQWRVVPNHLGKAHLFTHLQTSATGFTVRMTGGIMVPVWWGGRSVEAAAAARRWQRRKALLLVRVARMTPEKDAGCVALVRRPPPTKPKNTDE